MSRHERRSSLRYIALLLAIIACFCAAPSAEANAAAAAAVQAHASAAAQECAAAVALAHSSASAQGGADALAHASAAAVPDRVALSSISSANYREITLSWKEAAGANYYFVYYKAVGAAEWTKIATVRSTRLSYTHVSSKTYPILVGRNYTYMVRGYNSATKKAGDYDHRGLTIRTLPDPVPLKSASWNEPGDAVTVTWGKAAGGNYYRIYRKTASSPVWKSVATIKNTRTSYVDKSPISGEKNYYTVRVYNNKMKVLGYCNTNGIAAVSHTEYMETEGTAKLLKKTRTAGKTSQIILVVDHNLSFWEKDADGDWSRKLSVYCGYGRNGLNDDRYEGDKTTPIGSFPILHAFGIASNPGTPMQYKKVTSNSYWSGEYSTYNQWVESSRKVSGEHLIDYYQYKYAMAIGFNRNPTVYKKGSAIFLHCKSYDHWYTAGCVSVEESVMKKLLLMSRNGVYMIIVGNRGDIASY